jgi:hypothetical protein
MEYIVHYPCGLGLKDIVGMGNTALVGRLDAVVKFADRKELKALEIEKRVYFILRITSNVGNRNSVLYWYLYIAGQQSSGSKLSDWL